MSLALGQQLMNMCSKYTDYNKMEKEIQACLLPDKWLFRTQL